MTATIRTILGDRPAGELGRCSAHEHVIIDGPWIAAHHRDFLLDDVDAALVDLGQFKAAGGGWLIDTMPTGAGRHALKLAEAARRSGVAIVCPTGLHLPIYYPDDHPMHSMDREALAGLFVREITEAIDDGDGPLPHRAGVIKVAGTQPMTDHQREAFIAAAEAQHRTGCPIITHTERGAGGLEQARLLIEHGADPDHIVLSHCDRQPDPRYHRELLATGVRLEYDAAFRWHDRPGNPTVDLLAALAPEYPGQLMVGMDLARRRYWRGHGGAPGLAWLMTELPGLLQDAGLRPPQIEWLLADNPRHAFRFASHPTPLEQPTP